ncbi:DUF7158 domain-containing protein [Mycobacterium hubeiense]|uniref:DUF7158 domain-containing protein n=1 Tax=Mycobacterium hubeiense TaxID=1867256 RepID=UPI000C7F6376|nr:malonyl CoA-ACP transacylase [Mycobacterium sp. QGD 101]
MIAATVGGVPVTVEDVDARENELRSTRLAAALPRPGTSEGRQLRRWLTQLLVAERVVASEARARGVRADGASAEDHLLPDIAARLDIGSIAASVLADPMARALFAHLTAGVDVTEEQVAAFHARNPHRFAPTPVKPVVRHGWRSRAPDPPALDEVRPAIAAHLRAAAQRRAFRLWLDARCAELVELAPGYEHPGDPRQPDNTHRH